MISKCHILDRLARESSAIADERTDVDGGCTDTDDERTFIGDGGRSRRDVVENSGPRI
jgi:hypothetical protein